MTYLLDLVHPKRHPEGYGWDTAQRSFPARVGERSSGGTCADISTQACESLWDRGL